MSIIVAIVTVGENVHAFESSTDAYDYARNLIEVQRVSRRQVHVHPFVPVEPVEEGLDTGEEQE